jgi:hypothetical protein
MSSKRGDILDAFYSFTTVMTIANGYNYDWGTLKSRNNGSYATMAKGAYFNVSILPEECEGLAGQNIFHLNADVKITGLVRSVLSDVLDENDYDVQQSVSKMVEDIRRGFANPAYTLLCAAGCHEIVYNGQIEEEILTGDGVKVSLNFTIKWFDERF